MSALLLSAAFVAMALSRPRLASERVADRVADGKVPLPLTAATPISFAATFRAADVALGVQRVGKGYAYFADPSTSRKEVRAMLHGLSETRQLGAAISVLSSAIGQRLAADGLPDAGLTQTDDERLVSIVLNACVEQGRMDLSSGLLLLMRDRGVPLSSLTFCILFKGHGRAGDLRRVRKLHAAILTRNVALDVPTCNALLHAYARHGELADAEKVLADMPSYGVQPSSRTYNILLNGFVQLGRMPEAFGVAIRMRAALGADGANAVTYATLIHGCVRQNELRMARMLMQRLEDGEADGVEPDVYCYTALIRGLLTPPQPPELSTNGAVLRAARSRRSNGRIKVRVAPQFAHMYACRVEESLKLTEQMLARGVQPSAVCVGTLVGGCLEHADNVTAARSAAELLRAHGDSVGDASLGLAADSALIVGYCRQPITDRSRLRAALELFAAHSGAAAAGPRLDVRTCNALVAALATSGELQSAERVMRAMDAGHAHVPNAHTLCIMIRAYGAAGFTHFGQATRLWERLVIEGWVDTVSLNAWLATCMANGEERLALQAFQTAKATLPGLALDRVTFGALIQGLCGLHSTTASARRALQLWAEMRERGLRADRSIVASLFAACRRHLDIETSLRLRTELLAQGWPERQLREYSVLLLPQLPPLMDVLAEPEKWAALGVFPSADITSEQSQLLLDVPASLAPTLASADPTGAAVAKAEEEGCFAPIVPTCGEEHCGALASILENARSEEQQLAEPGASARPASVSQEIFERKGWNEMDGSGWRPWRPW